MLTERTEPTHIPGDGFDRRDEPQEGLRDVYRYIILYGNARGLEHGVGAEAAGNVRAALVLPFPRCFDRFCGIVHDTQQLFCDFSFPSFRSCLGIFLTITWIPLITLGVLSCPSRFSFRTAIGNPRPLTSLFFSREI